MSIRASCGHTLTDSDGPDGMGHPVSIKSWDRQGERAITEAVYCTSCRDEVARENLLIVFGEEEWAWLEGPDDALDDVEFTDDN